MKTLLGILAVVFIVAGIAGFSFGLVPAVVFWTFALLCIVGVIGPRKGRTAQTSDPIEREIR